MQLGVRSDRSIVESLQDIVVLLETQLHPLVQAESSVIVDILFQPEYLFPQGSEARKKCEDGRCIHRYEICDGLLFVLKLDIFLLNLTNDMLLSYFTG